MTSSNSPHSDNEMKNWTLSTKRKALLIETGCLSGLVYLMADNLWGSWVLQAPAGAKHAAFPNLSTVVCYLQKQAMG